MSQQVTVTPNESWPTASKVTLDRLRRAAKPTVALSGSVGTSDLDAGAVTTAKTTPGAYFYAAVSGTDAMTLTLSPAMASLADGAVVRFKSNGNKTSAATLDVNALGAKKVLKHGGTALDTGDIKTNQMVELVYNSSLDGGAGAWEMTSQLGQAPNKYAADVGATDDYAITLDPAPPVYYTGLVVRFKANTVNTGAATLNVNALGAKTIKKFGAIDLNGGDIVANQLNEVIYDGTNFQLLSPACQGPLKYASDAGSTDSYAVSLTPAPTEYWAGLVVWFKANTVNTGAATLNVNSLGAKTIKKRGSFDLGDGDIRANEIVQVVYDGTNFQLNGHTPVNFSATGLTVPGAGSAVGNQAHGMAIAPSFVRWVLVNSTADAGYVTGDEIEIALVDGATNVPGFGAVSDSTNLNLMRWAAATTLYVAHKTTGATTAITTSNWRLKVYANL